MNTQTKTTALVRAHTSTPAGMTFYSSLESIRRDAGLLGYVSVIERAWLEMKLNGVLCLDGRPILYFKEYGRPYSLHKRIFLQKLFWNQGVANVLVLADPTSVYIYSGLAKPPSDQTDEEAMETVLVDTLTQADYMQRIQTLYHDLATGHYYEANRKNFDPNQSVDSWLLDNLRALRNSLIDGDEKLDTKEAHSFIGRVLFLCYLLDRNIVSVGSPEKGRTGTMLFADLLDERRHTARINYLYDLFDDLKEQFNGNMFDQDLDIERRLLKPTHLKKLILFLGGHNVGSGQRTLGFWAFDFKMIPVETISAIYQDFLATEDKDKQKKHGAFYTPRFLAEMVVDMAVHDEPDVLDGTFLDPACGSGIFLVILFNRLARRWLHAQTKHRDCITKAKALQEILARQIRGVDVEETACRIACFSLYLAYLDFFNPPDIRNHVKKIGRPLPKLLNYGDNSNHPTADIPVILKADFLDEETLAGKTFDCILGNPPWEGRGSKELAHKFMQKAPHFLKDDGTGCLLLPTKILQNQTNAFKAEWLKQVTLEQVLQLADYRRLLFQNAITPAFIARFTKRPPELNHHMIEFTAPKFNRDGLRQGVINVNPSTRTWIPLTDILTATQSKSAPVVWKRRLWGTPRDQKLLDLLQSLPTLSDIAGAPKEGKRWNIGVGFQPNTSGKSKNPKPPWWNKSDLFIGAKASCWASRIIQVHKDDCEEIGDRFPSLHRPRDKRIYKSPMVLVSKGFNKVAFCDFDVLFQDSLKSINGPREDADLLRFLAAYLRSNLARYFLFHTSANWGSERDQIHLNELLRVPFPLPGYELISPDVEQIVKLVAKKNETLQKALQKKHKQLRDKARKNYFFDVDEVALQKRWHLERKKRIEALQKEIEPLIYRYFGLTEQEITLIEDTIHIFEPSSTPTNWRSPQTVTLEPTEKTKVDPYASQGLGAYADTLTKTLNTWAITENSNCRVRAEGGTDQQTGLAMITVILQHSEAKFQHKTLTRKLTEVLKELHSHASKKRGKLHYERDIFVFADKQIHIVRPNILLNWTRTAALNDAAKIYGEIALAKRES